MTQFQKVSLFLLRVSLGWMFFYSGITKIMSGTFSAAGYLESAKTFPVFFHWFLNPGVLPFVNGINEWGQLLLGISLILGIFVRLSSSFGIILMLLYYLPILDFPYPDPHSYIVDQHVIYAAALLFFAAIRAGRIWGLDNWCSKLQNILG